LHSLRVRGLILALAHPARAEACRSRSASLGSNRIFEAAVSAALEGLIEVDEAGNVKLKPGVQPGDIEKISRARATHIKSTMLVTGEAAANSRASAAAGAPRIILGAPLQPTPITLEAPESSAGT
jgi:hypothetical protein